MTHALANEALVFLACVAGSLFLLGMAIATGGALKARAYQQIYRQDADLADALQSALAELPKPAGSSEEREALRDIINWADLALNNSNEFDSHGVLVLTGPAFDRARRLLAKGAAA